MSASRLREALAVVYRRQRAESPTLTREAERAIGRRVATRWLLGAASVAVVGVVASVGWSAVLTAPSESAPSDAAPSSEPQVLPAVAHIPLSGGPPYVHPWGDLECGDPVPSAHPEAPHQRLSLDLATSGTDSTVTGALTWAAPEENAAALRQPVMGVGAVLVVAAREGVVVGMRVLQVPVLGWQQSGTEATKTAPLTLGTRQFSCVTFNEHTQQYEGGDVTLDAGAYEVFAVTRIFATPESVALFQATNDPGLFVVSEDSRSDGEVFEPGSPECEELIDERLVVRACLPDVVPTASVDEATDTVTVLYDASALPQEFDVTLVSEPVEMMIR